MLSLKIASRFLRKNPGQTALIMAGIAVGIAVQIFVGSLITSLQADLIDTTVGSSAHITILPSEDATSVPGSLASSISKQEPLVSSAIPVRLFSAIFVDEDSSVPLSIKGADLASLDSVYGLSDRIEDGEFSFEPQLMRMGNIPAILIGTGFAQDNDRYVEGPLFLLLPDGREVPFVVRGIFDLGAAAANDRFAFVDSDAPADALGMGAVDYTAIEIQLTDVFASTEVAARLDNDPNIEVVDWQTENEELLAGLSAQSGSSAMIQIFVLIAVALGIASTLAISAVQKTRQIGILKAMGMGDGAAGRIFLWQAALLGVGGALAGLALGWLLIWGFGFVPVPFSIRIEPRFAAISVVIGISVAMLSSIIPARSTSRLDPIEVIQNG